MIKKIRWWIGSKLVDFGDWIAGSMPYEWNCSFCDAGLCDEPDCICEDCWDN